MRDDLTRRIEEWTAACNRLGASLAAAATNNATLSAMIRQCERDSDRVLQRHIGRIRSLGTRPPGDESPK